MCSSNWHCSASKNLSEVGSRTAKRASKASSVPRPLHVSTRTSPRPGVAETQTTEDAARRKMEEMTLAMSQTMAQMFREDRVMVRVMVSSVPDPLTILTPLQALMAEPSRSIGGRGQSKKYPRAPRRFSQWMATEDRCYVMSSNECLLSSKFQCAQPILFSLTVFWLIVLFQ